MTEELKSDGWQNYLTGLNTLRDKRTAHRIGPAICLTDCELDDLFAGDDFAYRIVAELVETAMRQSFEIYDTGNTDAEKSAEAAKKLRESCDALGVDDAVTEAPIWGRLFGGGVILVNAMGAGLPDQPMGPNPRVTSLTVLDRRYLRPLTTYSNPLEPRYGQPELYEIQDPEAMGANRVVVHASRMVIFGGARTSRSRKKRNDGWDDSVLQRVHEVLRDSNSNWQSVAHLMTDASQSVFEIAGLTQMIAGNFSVTLHQRMEAIELGRSVARAILLDTNEKFSRIATSFSGLPEVLQETWIRLSAAANMPATVLMKQSPDGLNSTGESDLEVWYGTVQEYRENELRAPIEKIVHLIAASNGDPRPERWGIRFPPLKQLSAKERAEVEKTTADKDKTYIDAGVLSSGEVALSRYGKGEWSPETTIDANSRSTGLAETKANDIGTAESENSPDP